MINWERQKSNYPTVYQIMQLPPQTLHDANSLDVFELVSVPVSVWSAVHQCEWMGNDVSGWCASAYAVTWKETREISV